MCLVEGWKSWDERRPKMIGATVRRAGIDSTAPPVASSRMYTSSCLQTGAASGYRSRLLCLHISIHTIAESRLSQRGKVMGG